MVQSTLKKLEKLKAKKLKVTVDNKSSDYGNLCEALRNQNYAFDIKPGKGHNVTFIISTKWIKK